MPLPERGRSARSFANMSSNSGNLILPFLTTTFHYWGDTSARRSANMSSSSRNVKLPFLTTRCLYWGVDLPGGLPILALTVEMWNWHSWPLDASTGWVDLPGHLPIWALAAEMWNCHSWSLDASTGGDRSARWSANMSSSSRNVKLAFLTTRCHYQGVDLPLDLPIWALTVEASWSANMSSKSRNLISPFLTTRCHY